MINWETRSLTQSSCIFRRSLVSVWLDWNWLDSLMEEARLLFHRRQSDFLVVSFPFLSFLPPSFPSTALSLAVGKCGQKPHSLFIVGVSLQILTAWPPSAVPPRPSQNLLFCGLFFFCAVAGPRNALPTGLAHELCWVSALHWVVSLSLFLSVPHAAFQASGFEESTVVLFTPKIQRWIKFLLFLTKQWGETCPWESILNLLL